MRHIPFHSPAQSHHEALWLSALILLLLMVVAGAALAAWYLPTVQSFWPDLPKPGPILFLP